MTLTDRIMLVPFVLVGLCVLAALGRLLYFVYVNDAWDTLGVGLAVFTLLIWVFISLEYFSRIALHKRKKAARLK